MCNAMSLFERDDVKTTSGPCKICLKTTRSHVLQKALYENYVTEVVTDKSDEFANKQWEETEEVTKMRKVKEAVVVCHVCWLKRREEIQEILEKEYPKWEKSPSNHTGRIKIVAEICDSYQFEEELNQMRDLISMIKETATQ